MTDSTSPATVYLERIRAQDEGALSELMESYMPLIERWVRKERGDHLRDGFETLDCVQDVAVDLVRYLPNVRIENTDAFRGLLYRMIQNSLRNKHHYLNVRRRTLATDQPLGPDTVIRLDPPDEHMPTPSVEVGNQEQQAWLRFALALLESEEQELILRRHFDGEAFEEIGKSMGTTPDGARMRFNRARAKLMVLVGRLRRGECAESAQNPPPPPNG
jgi:RNA polymerase sigma factor (sigma-70 family)